MAHITGTQGLSRREFLARGGRTLLATALASMATITARNALGVQTDELKAQRLTWAGVKLVSGDTTIFIDPLSTDIWEGAWKDAVFVPMQVETSRRAVLITHAHNDHFDPKAISAIFEKTQGPVFCHDKIAELVSSRGFRTRPLAMYEPVSYDNFTLAPVPASDAFDDDQVSWVVTAGGRRIIHCGDTQWHGAWWKIGRQYGPFDAAFLPINGVVFKGPAVTPNSEVPGDMTPEQAVAAGVVMGAKLVVPIHYGFNDPAAYVEYPEAEKTFLATARRRKQPVELLKPGEWLKWKPNV
ncbi:MAG: MBL fold metallo-hydrolase [Acidobacteria bacterium]|nr:MBL fold metallo-hydrolase [Acidobacteriota bacterium]